MSQISRSGCYVDTTSPLPVGTSLSVSLQLLGRVVEGEATVRTSQPSLGMGLGFTHLDDTNQAALDEVLARFGGGAEPLPAAAEAQPTTSSPEIFHNAKLDLEQGYEARIRPTKRLRVEYVDYQPAVRDINLSGAYIEDSRASFSRGQVFQVRIWLEGEIFITVNAMVRHIEQGKGIGVEFVGMSNADRAHLRRFLDAQQFGATPPSNN